jgi:hypothetical protein
VRGEQDGQPVAGHSPDLRPQLGPGLRVEPGGRLVEEQHVRSVDQTERDVEPALHTAGVGADRTVRGLGKIEPVEQLDHPLLEPAATQSVQPALQHEVVPAGGQRVGAGVLGDHSDPPPDPVRVAEHVVAVDHGPAGVRPGQRGQDLDSGGLAGAVRAEQAEHLAGADLDGEAVERGDATGIGLHQVVRGYRRHRVGDHVVSLVGRIGFEPDPRRPAPIESMASHLAGCR